MNSNKQGKKKIQRTKNRSNQMVGLLRPFPPSKQLRCVALTDGIAQAAASFVVIESRLMSLAQLGFAGGTGPFTTAITGLLDASAYALARARSFYIKISVVGAEAANIDSICCIFSDTQPSTVITSYPLARAAAVSYLHTPMKRLAVALGNPAYDIPDIKVSAVQILSDPSISDDRDFVCTLNPVAAVSPQELWAAIIVTSTGPLTNLVQGVQMSVTNTVDYEAFSRLPGA